MRERFNIEVVNGDYSYKSKFPLVDSSNQFLRGYYISELMRIIELTETVLNPGLSNAPSIPSFLFFGTKTKDLIEPFLKINIPRGSNKYHCCLRSYKEHKLSNGKLSGYFPDTPFALKNSISLHLASAIAEIQEKNHSLPMTFIYQIGMNDDHVGIVALRLCSFEDLSQNEILVINSLNCYDNWEQAAINGLVESLQTNSLGSPKLMVIKPETYKGVKQSSCDMQASCAGIVAAMSLAISSHSSFASQKNSLVNYMRSLCGKENEAALRRDHQKLLAQTHPLDKEFDCEAVKEILKSSKKATAKISVNRQHNFLLENSSASSSKETGWELPTWLKIGLFCLPVIGWFILLVCECLNAQVNEEFNEGFAMV